MKIKTISLIALVSIFSAPVISDAGFYYCPVITDRGQNNQHKKWGKSMSKWNSVLSDEYATELDKGPPEEAAQKEITANFSKTSENYVSSVSAAFRQHAIALSVHMNQRDYSPYAKSLDACFAREESTGIAQGQVYANQQYVGLLETTQEYSKQTDTIKTKQKLFKKLADPDETVIEDSGRLFPADNQISKEESKQIEETIILATDPLPYPILTDEYQKNVPAGLKFMATKKIKDLHVSVAQQALAEIVSKKIAVYDMKDWSTKVSPILAGRLPEGELSADQLLDLQVGMRFQDPNRIVRNHKLLPTGAYRELAAVKAVNLELSRRILRHAEKEIFMAASSEALSTNIDMLPELSKTYGYNIGQAYGD